MTQEHIRILNKKGTVSAETVIKTALELFKEDLLLASSLGAEDQVLSDLLLTHSPKSRIFVLDTGRLHQETYNVMQKTIEKYGNTYEVYYPKTNALETFVREKGINAFYENIDNRKACCHIRKVEPLQRALKTCKAWITGLRREQSSTRTDIPIAEWDESHQVIKINPLAHWTEKEVWSYIKDRNVPYNVLHDQGFPSIGCAPCTRAIEKGEDKRAGRWWWENPETKECGLHFVDGKMVRNPKNDKEKETFL